MTVTVKAVTCNDLIWVQFESISGNKWALRWSLENQNDILTKK